MMKTLNQLKRERSRLLAGLSKIEQSIALWTRPKKKKAKR